MDSKELNTSSAPLGAAIEQVLISGNLNSLTPEQRVSYYNKTCESLGLNPLTRPFEYITLSGKLTFYARKDCTEQLRNVQGVSIGISSREVVEGVYVVTARASNQAGRSDESIGAVPIDGLKGESRANAMMKAETKAKRRVTLSFCGLGMFDETEIESIPGAWLMAQQAQARPTTINAEVVTPPGPKASAEQIKALCAAMNAIGIKDREDVLAWCAERIGHPIGSRKDLTVAECSVCIDATKAPAPAEPEPGSDG
jgi:hypothetical protein